MKKESECGLSWDELRELAHCEPTPEQLAKQELARQHLARMHAAYGKLVPVKPRYTPEELKPEKPKRKYRPRQKKEIATVSEPVGRKDVYEPKYEFYKTIDDFRGLPAAATRIRPWRQFWVQFEEPPQQRRRPLQMHVACR